MAWMRVSLRVRAQGTEPEHTVDNVVNMDTITRVGRFLDGSYIRTMDGNSFEVVDSYESIVASILKAESK